MWTWLPHSRGYVSRFGAENPRLRALLDAEGGHDDVVVDRFEGHGPGHDRGDAEGGQEEGRHAPLADDVDEVSLFAGLGHADHGGVAGGHALGPGPVGLEGPHVLIEVGGPALDVDAVLGLDETDLDEDLGLVRFRQVPRDLADEGLALVPLFLDDCRRRSSSG
ncbi:MAG: hypothetical protein MZV64_10740 [Ignavibacteriales bacterium]|nr:hypothetical protein [Ignavibacteriales bacterium]